MWAPSLHWAQHGDRALAFPGRSPCCRTDAGAPSRARRRSTGSSPAGPGATSHIRASVARFPICCSWSRRDGCKPRRTRFAARESLWRTCGRLWRSAYRPGGLIMALSASSFASKTAMRCSSASSRCVFEPSPLVETPHLCATSVCDAPKISAKAATSSADTSRWSLKTSARSSSLKPAAAAKAARGKFSAAKRASNQVRSKNRAIYIPAQPAARVLDFVIAFAVFFVLFPV